MSDRVLIWSQHSLGLGHLTRTLTLAGALAERFNVTVASGGSLPEGLALPAGVEIQALEAVRANGSFTIRGASDSGDVRAVLSRRRRHLLELVGELQPRVVILELFPFGRRKFRSEVGAVIAAARRLRPRAFVVTSVRDILVQGRTRQAMQDAWALEVANASLDAVLVHADPRLAAFGESFPHLGRLRPQVHHTGFVVAPRRSAPLGRASEVVVSAGGGRVGAPLLACAIDAFPLLAARGLDLRVIGGPLMPDEEWAALCARAGDRPGLSLHRSVPDLRALVAGCAASVSQCGYNTTLEVVAERTPCVVVPYVTASEDEQLRRAQRLAAMGAVRHLAAERLTPAALTAAITDAINRSHPAAASRLDLAGAERSAGILADLLAGELAAAA